MEAVRGLNRTSVGLKFYRTLQEVSGDSGLNRTSVGLKFSPRGRRAAIIAGASIEPAWD